jgi:hypothetical protein
LRYGLTERGRASARDALSRSGYLGAAPFPVSAYRSLLKVQTIHHGRITAGDMHTAFHGVVLANSMLDQLGVAMNSGRAIMIYGPAGTGKTYISSRLIRLFAEAIWVPYAIVVNESVIEIFDPQVHQRLDEGEQNKLLLDQGIDRRLLCCKRPIVITGGELSMEQLDIRYDPFSRLYQAPLQLKASNGLFIIDDMGRQRMAPAELLNRWIVPMEEKRDFLNLGGGRHCELPFDLILVFSTNLNPLELADEAFLRRSRRNTDASGTRKPIAWVSPLTRCCCAMCCRGFTRIRGCRWCLVIPATCSAWPRIASATWANRDPCRPATWSGPGTTISSSSKALDKETPT